MNAALTGAPAGTVEIRLSLPPVWPKADAVAILAKAAISAAYAQTDLGDRVGIVAGELMENAIKYGEWSNADELTFSLSSIGERLQIEVSCPCDPSSSHYERLMAALHAIQQADARKSYLERLIQLSQDRRQRGGLGLLRLAYEANCTLRAELCDGRLRVHASIDPAG